MAKIDLEHEREMRKLQLEEFRLKIGNLNTLGISDLGNEANKPRKNHTSEKSWFSHFTFDLELVATAALAGLLVILGAIRVGLLSYGSKAL